FGLCSWRVFLRKTFCLTDDEGRVGGRDQETSWPLVLEEVVHRCAVAGVAITDQAHRDRTPGPGGDQRVGRGRCRPIRPEEDQLWLRFRVLCLKCSRISKDNRVHWLGKANGTDIPRF